MAGEWLKFESNLPEKPEVLAITASMGWDDPDLTVGKLMRLFRWFDQHTTDGNAYGVTSALLDRVIGVTGFVQAVQKAGWIVVSADGIALNHFDYHNGASAKTRAQTAKRVANHRASAPSDDGRNAPTVTPALAREEKRREEKKDKTEDRERSPSGSRLPVDWVAPDEWLEHCRETRPDLDASVVACNFADYWHGKAGKDARKVDWHATWRTWVRKESPPPQRGRSPPESFRERDERVAKERYERAIGIRQPTQSTILEEVIDVTPRALGR